MADDDKSRSWWQTLPGIITAATALVTAIAGLIAGIHQTGWFSSNPATPAQTTTTAAQTAGGSPPAPSASSSSPSGETTPATGATPPVSGATPSASATAAPSQVVARAPYAIALPAMRDYKLGAVVFTLLKAEVSPQTTEKDALKIHVRMTNNDRFPTNFWDSSFRLILDGVPLAPEGGLNEVVASQAAKEGDVLFVIPRGTSSARLKIIWSDNANTEVPLELKASP